MSKSRTHRAVTSPAIRLQRPPLCKRLLPGALACAATLLSLPIQAEVEIPPVPLQSGTAYPAPNIMFILDDSGSMVFQTMPDSTYDNELENDIQDRSYVHNPIYYNPAVTYRTWMGADGERLTGGDAYSAVYPDLSRVGGNTIDLADDDSCRDVSENSTSSNLEVCGGTQFFYVPKDDTSDLSDRENYYRYRFRDGKLTRFEIIKVKGDEEWGNDANMASVTWEGEITRTLAQEKQNFAIWYSYHRTRMKVAKAGASEAFGQLGENYRVGYDSIWNRDGTSSVSGDDPAYEIPVADDDGLFKDVNRTAWFDYLHRAWGFNGTPLHDALYRTGEYFESDEPENPWTSEGGTEISCRQNFAILTTDGYWNSRSKGKGNGQYGGDADSTAGTEILRPEGDLGNPYTYAPVRPYRDGRSDTLADVAMHYWKRDLRDDLDNNVPASAVANPAFWQHMVTFGISIGLVGELNPDTDLPALTNGDKQWPNPVLSNTDGDAAFPSRIDDLWHAAVNSRGQFVAATDPDQFTQGLLDALTTVAERMGSASNVTANSTSLQSDTRLYQASYVSGRWTGELQAYDVSDAGTSDTPEWQASQLIPAERTILTWVGSGGGDFVAQVADDSALARTTGLAQVTSAENAAYIAGDQSQEKLNGGVLRDRTTVLGDIANSSPTYVKEIETIFVGANDGMLHAFATLARGQGSNNIAAGEELFGYVPAGIDLAALATLSDPQYAGNHQYFVDGPVVVSATTQTPDGNYLVGALGRGGKGVFGLDVTDPDSFGPNDVLWDKTFTVDGTAPAGFGNMGQVLGDPLVVTLNNGDKGVIVGNGINSATGTASLFILDIATGLVIKELNTGATGDNALFAPRGADLDADGAVDQVYAGDLKGNLWKFDLTGSNQANWDIANAGDPMFVATDSAGKRQPITAGVALARDPATQKIWVFVGTGSFMTDADVDNNDVQSLYGLIDSGATIERDELDQQEIDQVEVMAGRSVRTFEPHTASLDGLMKGWVIDLDDPEPGERIVSNPRVDGTVLVATSIVPPSGNSCDAGGTGYVNAVDAFTGTSTEFPYFDANADGRIDEDDTITVDGVEVPVGSLGTDAMPSLAVRIGNKLFYGLSDGGVGDEDFDPIGSLARRTSWREILGDG